MCRRWANWSCIKHNVYVIDMFLTTVYKCNRQNGTFKRVSNYHVNPFRISSFILSLGTIVIADSHLLVYIDLRRDWNCFLLKEDYLNWPFQFHSEYKSTIILSTFEIMNRGLIYTNTKLLRKLPLYRSPTRYNALFVASNGN